jgi:hypothetical protein
MSQAHLDLTSISEAALPKQIRHMTSVVILRSITNGLHFAAKNTCSFGRHDFLRGPFMPSMSFPHGVRFNCLLRHSFLQDLLAVGFAAKMEPIRFENQGEVLMPEPIDHDTASNVPPLASTCESHATTIECDRPEQLPDFPLLMHVDPEGVKSSE